MEKMIESNNENVLLEQALEMVSKNKFWNIIDTYKVTWLSNSYDKIECYDEIYCWESELFIKNWWYDFIKTCLDNREIRIKIFQNNNLIYRQLVSFLSKLEPIKIQLRIEEKLDLLLEEKNTNQVTKQIPIKVKEIVENK